MFNTANETAKMMVEIGAGRRGNPIIMQNCITAKLHNCLNASEMTLRFVYCLYKNIPFDVIWDKRQVLIAKFVARRYL